MLMIKNAARYADEYKYIVAREVDGEMWFYGAWNTLTSALDAASAIKGKIFERDEVTLEFRGERR